MPSPKKTRKAWVWACNIIGVPLAVIGMALAAPGIALAFLGMSISERRAYSPLTPTEETDHGPCRCGECGAPLRECPKCEKCCNYRATLTLEECK